MVCEVVSFLSSLRKDNTCKHLFAVSVDMVSCNYIPQKHYTAVSFIFIFATLYKETHQDNETVDLCYQMPRTKKRELDIIPKVLRRVFV